MSALYNGRNGGGGTTRMTDSPAGGALARFTVLDLTRYRAGPTAARQLADWGADVIKIEAPGTPGAANDPIKNRHGPDFQNLHRNKRSLTLNLKEPDGVAIFKQLATGADVVVENYRPDVKHRLGIDYETLRALNAGLVYASLSGFGQDGPYEERPGFDQIAQGMGGLMSITGEPGRGPMRVGIPIADLSAGLYTAIGILVALLERESSGEGQWVQSSLLQAMIAQLDFQAARYLFEGTAPGQAGNDHPTTIPTGVFETADGYINIATSDGAIYERLCHALGLPELDRRCALCDRKRPLREPGPAQRPHRRAHPHEDQRRLGGGAERGGRSVRADLRHRRDVRRPAGSPSRHGRAGRAPDPWSDAHRLPGDQAQPHAVPCSFGDARARRPHRRDSRGARLR